jgi:hypothetical protein
MRYSNRPADVAFLHFGDISAVPSESAMRAKADFSAQLVVASIGQSWRAAVLPVHFVNIVLLIRNASTAEAGAGL